jgi:hypothetical protein
MASSLNLCSSFLSICTLSDMAYDIMVIRLDCYMFFFPLRAGVSADLRSDE